MDLQDQNNRDRNGIGRPLQEIGSVGIGLDETKTEGKESGRKGIVRRATFDDLDAIMDINDNIYLGFDYMPALFYTFMQSKLHAIYVYEEDGKLVSLINFRFHPDCDDLVTGMSARVRPSHEGRGVGISIRSLIHAQLFKEYPVIKRRVADSLCIPELSARMNKFMVNYHWNILHYNFVDRRYINRLASIRQMAFVANRPFSLSYTSGTEWLERSDQLIRFISKYVKDLFPCGAAWIPTPANRTGLRHVLSCANVYVSKDTISTNGNNRSSDLKQPGKEESDIVGLSYSTACPGKNGVTFNIFFYGDSEQVLQSHVYSHLHHYNEISSDGVGIRFILHFPLSIDSKNAEVLLKEGMGERFQDGRPSQAVQYIEDLPQAKL